MASPSPDLWGYTEAPGVSLVSFLGMIYSEATGPSSRRARTPPARQPEAGGCQAAALSVGPLPSQLLACPSLLSQQDEGWRCGRRRERREEGPGTPVRGEQPAGLGLPSLASGRRRAPSLRLNSPGCPGQGCRQPWAGSRAEPGGGCGRAWASGTREFHDNQSDARAGVCSGLVLRIW